MVSMRSSCVCVLVLLSCAVLATMQSCATDGKSEDGVAATTGRGRNRRRFAARNSEWFRHVDGGRNGTIFSPLDLPAPNDVRTGSGAPGSKYWQQQADYIINASLDTETSIISGEATITYTNNSPDPLDYIWLHFEQNIFRADSIAAQIASRTSIGMREAFGNGYTIHHLRAGSEDLEFHVYDTMARIDLPDAIQPYGGEFTFNIAWQFTIPDRAFRRFGRQEVEQGTIYEIAQWFPAVAVYDDMFGWNTLGYLGSGEFYTNFGSYEVNLTVPHSHIVAATGVLQNPEAVFTAEQLSRLSEARRSPDTVLILGPDEVGDTASRPSGDSPLTWRFKAENVRTFAWASSDAFIYDACDLDGILVQSVYPKEAMPVWSDSTQMLRTAINNYNELWFPYPYPEATNVNGPEGGMEYPMLIFCGSRRSERGLYGVTAHEIGHNWFPMVVNTDERRHAWMDEGFNTFINYYAYGDWFEGETPRRGGAASFARSMTSKTLVPIETYPDRLPPWLLGQLEYSKTAVGLVLLREQILGPERFDEAFRTYIRRWAFKSPRPSDFFRTIEDVAGADLAWFWRGWFLETSYLDQAVSKVEETVRENDDENNDNSNQQGARFVTVTIDNLAELVMPVVFEVTYEDGSTETRNLPVEIWFNSNRYEARFPVTQPVTKVEIDAEQKFPDVKRDNNTWSAKKSAKG